MVYSATLAGKRVLVDLANAGQFTYLEEASAMNRACGHDVLTKPRVRISRDWRSRGFVFININMWYPHFAKTDTDCSLARSW